MHEAMFQGLPRTKETSELTHTDGTILTTQQAVPTYGVHACVLEKASYSQMASTAGHEPAREMPLTSRARRRHVYRCCPLRDVRGVGAGVSVVTY